MALGPRRWRAHGWTAPQPDDTTTVELAVGGMHWQSPALIEETLVRDLAVTRAVAGLDSARAFVSHGPNRIPIDDLCVVVVTKPGCSAAPGDVQ